MKRDGTVTKTRWFSNITHVLVHFSSSADLGYVTQTYQCLKSLVTYNKGLKFTDDFKVVHESGTSNSAILTELHLDGGDRDGVTASSRNWVQF